MNERFLFNMDKEDKINLPTGIGEVQKGIDLNTVFENSSPVNMIVTHFDYSKMNLCKPQIGDHNVDNVTFPPINLSLSKNIDISEPQTQAVSVNTEMAPMVINSVTAPMTNIFRESLLQFPDKDLIFKEQGIEEMNSLPRGIFNSFPITEYLVDESEFVINNSNYECQQCGYTISSKRRYMMKNHILAEHKGVRHKCNKCNYEGKSREKLNAHTKKVHLKRINEPETFEHFVDDSEFVLKDSNFECKQCGYTISNKRRYMMKNHILAEHKGVRHKCNECNYEGKSKEKLNAHIKRVHFGKSSNPYKVNDESQGFSCDKCDFRTFRGMYELNLHIQAEHEGIRHFCWECSFSSKRKDIVQRHMKQKHLGIVFKCDLCTYTSSWKYSLQRHVSRSHGADSGIQIFNQNNDKVPSFIITQQNVPLNNFQLVTPASVGQ